MDVFPYMTVVTYTCEPGRVLAGTASIFCNTVDGKRGAWSGPPPRCGGECCNYGGRQIFINGVQCLPPLVSEGYFPYLTIFSPSLPQRCSVLPLQASPTGSTAASPWTRSCLVQLFSTPVRMAICSLGTHPSPALLQEPGAGPSHAVKVCLCQPLGTWVVSFLLALGLTTTHQIPTEERPRGPNMENLSSTTG